MPIRHLVYCAELLAPNPSMQENSYNLSGEVKINLSFPVVASLLSNYRVEGAKKSD